ncbi:formate dehydrogenase subunit delta [Spongiibacter sp. KMU-166]|uniref:Formate dehydrogenase subunit delta n=1 Tax=Spongiibacter thalassae TaxID=2721624 RepID=A0ABX1GBG4_9GAMM|nr:formate dehydrogenase subunit delta [Spongiibacter thalassae]NKI16504.1 formate dehydrogenase subunit delta [Spongiibacter thalassae]
MTNVTTNTLDSAEHLVRMANSIAENLRHGASSDSDAAQQVAHHLRRFWAGSMKTQLKQYVLAGGQGLSDVARQAIDLIG